MLPFGAKDLRELVRIWNDIFPLDRWYREKYSISFNSEKHKKVSFIDMYFEYFEYIEYQYKPRKIKELKQKREKEDIFSLENRNYTKGKGNFMKEYIPSRKDIDRMFEEFDIDKN